ncbi:hypothetical protein QVD17_09937 [Tagetes erecta]|uniref:Uncharacterized protein n=1 Tax=Tagetes erecta TaxID=13708 RepID=A0AAD8L1W4_TARER|nr:hypothetical protein QVD17_09937 [Tagetes erecta]
MFWFYDGELRKNQIDTTTQCRPAASLAPCFDAYCRSVALAPWPHGCWLLLPAAAVLTNCCSPALLLNLLLRPAVLTHLDISWVRTK